MRSWSFRVKVGVYAALLTTSALVAGAAVMLVTLCFHQIHELDDELQEDAEELVWDLGKFRDTPSDPSPPIHEEHIPVTLRGSDPIVEDPGGTMVYQSKNHRGSVARCEGGRFRNPAHPPKAPPRG